jgi:hypothetical protein
LKLKVRVGVGGVSNGFSDGFMSRCLFRHLSNKIKKIKIKKLLTISISIILSKIVEFPIVFDPIVISFGIGFDVILQVFGPIAA